MKFSPLNNNGQRGYSMTIQQRKSISDAIVTRGTKQVPSPPRDLQVQAGPRGALLTWKLPVNNSDIAGYRIYKGDENTLYEESHDRGRRQEFVELTAGATPPITNLFVSCLNAAGAESAKIQIKAQASAEAGAPTLPSTPPGYNDEGAGGGDQRLIGGRELNVF